MARRKIASRAERKTGTKVSRAKVRFALRPLYTAEDEHRQIEIFTDSEPEPYRTAYRRDYARVIHSPAFRRLQGKTQLFPGSETDFFRNRLTHSMEVAQIAKSIAIRINSTVPFFQRPNFRINTDLVETAALVHDIGHPPFGHNGEKALDECMKNRGGFEGNAQTLRILSATEKREKFSDSSVFGISIDGKDRRVGLNLTYRTLAAALKYDQEIPYDRRTSDAFTKGYYRTEAPLVRQIKKHVTGDENYPDFKTIECQIMDIADDIAYSTYDLEDAFKARFLTPLSMFGAPAPLITQVTKQVGKSLREEYTPSALISCLYRVFSDLFEDESNEELEWDDDQPGQSLALMIAHFSTLAEKLMSSGYLRAAFTSHLVGQFIRGIQVEPNEKLPALSKVTLHRDILETVEVLKHFTFYSLIMSPRLKVAEYRGLEIVRELFSVLTNRDGEGERLLPDDVQGLFSEIEEEYRNRVVCDFIAGMTDRYAIEFYGRLKSERPETIFKPH